MIYCLRYTPLGNYDSFLNVMWMQNILCTVPWWILLSNNVPPISLDFFLKFQKLPVKSHQSKTYIVIPPITPLLCGHSLLCIVACIAFSFLADLSSLTSSLGCCFFLLVFCWIMCHLCLKLEMPFSFNYLRCVAY